MSVQFSYVARCAFLNTSQIPKISH